MSHLPGKFCSQTRQTPTAQEASWEGLAMANCRGDHVLLSIALLSFVFVSPIIYLHAWSEKFSDLAFRKVESKITEIKGATISYPITSQYNFSLFCFSHRWVQHIAIRY